LTGACRPAGKPERRYDARQAEAWHDRARRLSGAVGELRGARTWSQESHRINPGGRLRRGVPLPSADWDAAWDRTVHHLGAAPRLLADAAAETEEDPGTPASTAGPVRRTGRLMSAAARVCRADERALAPTDPAEDRVPPEAATAARADAVSDEDFRHVVAAAWEAHEELRAALAEPGPRTRPRSRSRDAAWPHR
jgi:hypothetical protein